VIRRGDEFRIGPIRIPVMANNDGRCSVIAIYGEAGALGMSGTIDEAILEKLADEDGVIVKCATKKPKK
jgi:hypothetical protein